MFQRVWQPILSMEAATTAVNEADSLLCNNIPVTLSRCNGKYYGEFRLGYKFCKKRCIKLFNNSKDAEEESSDYLCIRYHTGQVSLIVITCAIVCSR